MSDCECCGGGETPGTQCTHCLTDKTPASRTAEFDGFGTPGCCPGAGNLNTTSFVLPQTTSCTLGISINCGFFAFFSIVLEFTATHLEVRVTYLMDGSQIIFRKALVAPYDCMAESLGPIPYFSHTGAGACGMGAGCTCTLAA